LKKYYILRTKLGIKEFKGVENYDLFEVQRG